MFHACMKLIYYCKKYVLCVHKTDIIVKNVSLVSFEINETCI